MVNRGVLRAAYYFTWVGVRVRVRLFIGFAIELVP